MVHLVWLGAYTLQTQVRVLIIHKGLLELHPHQYDRIMTVGSVSISKDSFLNVATEPTGLVTPIPSNEHRKCCEHESEV